MLSTAAPPGSPTRRSPPGSRELTGHIQQVPSAVSAVKVDGKRAYARVRAGEQVELAARPVEVSRFDLLGHPPRGRRDRTGRDGRVLVGHLRPRARPRPRRRARRRRPPRGAAADPRRAVRPAGRHARSTSSPRRPRCRCRWTTRSPPRSRATTSTTGRRARCCSASGCRLRASTGTYGVFDPDGRAIALAVDEAPRHARSWCWSPSRPRHRFGVGIPPPEDGGQPQCARGPPPAGFSP